MSLQVIENLHQGHTLVNDNTGPTLIRHYLVKGLTPSSRFLTDALFANDGTTHVPRWGEQDKDNTALYANRIEPMPFARDSLTDAHVYVTFRPPDFNNSPLPIVQFTGTTKEVTTNFDRAGRLIFVRSPYAPNDASKFVTVDARTTKAYGILTADWTAYSDPSWMLAYENAINQSMWRGHPAYCWWMRTVVIEQVIGQAGWRVHLEIQLDPDGFVDTYAWRDPITGAVPTNVKPVPIPKVPFTHDDGWVNPDLLNPMNFSNLPLPNALSFGSGGGFGGIIF